MISDFALRARETRRAYFHSPVTEIRQSREGGGNDMRDRGRVAQTDREGDYQNRDDHVPRYSI